MVYLSDAFVLFTNPDHQPDKHLLNFELYYILNMVSFCSLIVCCLLFAVQWIEIANNIRDEPDANKGFKKFIKYLLYICPFLVGGQVPLVYLEKYTYVSALFGTISLLIGSVATYAGMLFRRSLGDYFSGSYINNVRSFIQAYFLGQTKRGCNYLLLYDQGYL